MSEKSLNDRIAQLEDKIKNLASQLSMVHKSVKGKGNYVKPYSKVSPPPLRSTYKSVGRLGGGLSARYAGGVLWNDAETKDIKWFSQPETPTKGYNKHGHSRYAGGALPINTLELVEYKTNDAGEIIDKDEKALNKHCQSFWTKEPEIAKSDVEGYEDVEKIGNFLVEFDPETGTWQTLIDVQRTYIVRRNADGTIKTDLSVNKMKSPLNDKDEIDTHVNQNMVWDTNNLIWRFYAVWRPYVAP